jgi:hypothetical protein
MAEMLTHILPFTEAGLQIAWDITPGLRKAGYHTRLTESTVCGFPVYKVLAYRTRPNRKARGATL